MTQPPLSAVSLRPDVERIMENAWREPGFCVPNGDTYPHQWLWDSCFHSLVWSALGDDRAVVELANVLVNQDPSGFVPHMTYWADPDRHRSFWGRPLTSIITQPPMYGHAARRLVEAGWTLGDELIERIGRGLRHLLCERTRTRRGLIPVLHPWESGCDDSPRWDSHRNPAQSWRETKGLLVESLRGATSTSTVDPFAVGSVGFNALVVWNTREYLAIDGAAGAAELESAVDDVLAALAGRWDRSRRTWVDDGRTSGSVRTLDGLLPLLVDPRSAAFDELLDHDAYRAPFGPTGVHRDEPSYAPDLYWRGPAWPQLGYLLWVAAVRADRADVATSLARSLVDGAVVSGFAEYWHPETGAGLGARPQTWAALAYLVAE